MKNLKKKKLPNKECFFSSTKKGKIGDDFKILDGHISDKNYLTCKKTWDKFDMKDIGDYHDHYFRKDILLLADVFEKFIDTCLKFYWLDPCHYSSSPGLTWDAMLKMTGVKLEQIPDIDKYLFIKKGRKGGVSYTAQRWAKANNKYMKSHDPKNPSKFITYLDMNNLYGCGLRG